MKAAANRGAPVDAARMTQWVRRFRYYRQPPDEEAIRSWLESFREGSRDVAARILDCVEVISESQIQAGYRSSLRKIPGWAPTKRERDGNWYFAGFGYAGESGQAMVRIFREANKLNDARHDDLFCTVADIPSKRLTAADTIVFIDDFSGSGQQVCDRWNKNGIGFLVADAQAHLVVTTATDDAIKKIEKETTLTVHSHYRLHANDNFFSERCDRFTQAEKNAILHYCKIADATHPRGFHETGLLYVLQHKTPNNSLPILHANHAQWTGLFPRYLQPA
jgi:hypothetical protein